MEIYYKKSDREITSPNDYRKSSKFVNKVFIAFTMGVLIVMSILQGIYSINKEIFSRNPFCIWWVILLFVILWITSKIVIYYDNSETKYQKWAKC